MRYFTILLILSVTTSADSRVGHGQPTVAAQTRAGSAASGARIPVRPDSRLWLEGSSNVRDWTCKATTMEPGRAMVLENWGALHLEPIGTDITRMHIRTRGLGVPTVSGIAILPVALLIFEPAHFIMERGMMLGIKNRAEGANRKRK